MPNKQTGEEHEHEHEHDHVHGENCSHGPPQKPITVQKTGRNDPCPCSSGKKFKKCCGAAK